MLIMKRSINDVLIDISPVRFPTTPNQARTQRSPNCAKVRNIPFALTISVVAVRKDCDGVATAFRRHSLGKNVSLISIGQMPVPSELVAVNIALDVFPTARQTQYVGLVKKYTSLWALMVSSIFSPSDIDDNYTCFVHVAVDGSESDMAAAPRDEFTILACSVGSDASVVNISSSYLSILPTFDGPSMQARATVRVAFTFDFSKATWLTACLE